MFNWSCPYCEAGGQQIAMSEMAKFLLMGHLIDTHLERAFTDLINSLPDANKAQLLKGHQNVFCQTQVTSEASNQPEGFFAAQAISEPAQDGETNEATHGVPVEAIVSNPENEKPKGRKGRSEKRAALIEQAKRGKGPITG